MGRSYIVRFLLIATIALAMGCASIIGTETSFTPWRGEQIYKGAGGAVDVYEDIEFWKLGEPDRPYKVVGLITQKKSDDTLDKILFEKFNQKQIIKIVSNNEGNGVVILKRDRFVSGYTTQMPVNEYDSETISPEYTESSVLAVFRYVVSDDQLRPMQ